MLPRSHRVDPMPTQYDRDGRWIGCLRDEDVGEARHVEGGGPAGPAGSLTLHNCRTLHYSAKNTSDLGRPLLLNTLSSADAFPYTVNPIRSSKDQTIIRGKPRRLGAPRPAARA